MTCYQLIMNWLTNDLDFENNIPAFCLLKAPDVKHLGKSAMMQLRQMRSFMKIVERLACEYQAWPARLTSAVTFTSATVNDMWRIEALVLFEKYGKESQLNNFAIRWKTLFNQISKNGAFAKEGGWLLYYWLIVVFDLVSDCCVHNVLS
jgi:hypothetical protein